MFLWLNKAGYYNTLQESAAINPCLGLFPMLHCTVETLLYFLVGKRLDEGLSQAEQMC